MTAPADSTTVPSRRAHVSPLSNRRVLLGGIAIAPALTVSALATSHPDAELLRLGRLLDQAWMAERHTYDAAAGSHTTDTETNYEEACGLTSGFVEQIEAATATTLVGLLVKARACSWCHNGESMRDEDFGEQPTTNIRLAVGVIRDLLAMQGEV